jgi:nicotinamide-nucleotide amidase
MPEPLDNIALKLSELLKQHHWKLATAESCTGGGVAYLLTQLAGSSAWFERGFVTYSNLAKEEMLGVSPLTLTQHGAVSEETALAMASGALQNSQAEVSLSITGIAGPDGGTLDKPVGTVWFGWGIKDQEISAEKKLLVGNRDQIRLAAIEFSLQRLVQLLTLY